MIRARSFAVLLTSILLIGVLGARRLRPEAALEPAVPYTVSAGRLVLAPGSRFLSRLEIVEVGRAAKDSREFRSVGQIIALSNASGALTGRRVGWVELEPRLTASVALKLEDDAPAGVAYGLTNLPRDYASRVAVGQTVRIARYGLTKGGVSAVIRNVAPVVGDGIDVVFRLSAAQDWFPGTNCEVDFPMLSDHPVMIPTTAPVHDGAQEYVWKEIAPGRFEAQSISLIDATPVEVSVLGLKAGDRVVGRGAILLKPLLRSLLAPALPQGGG